MNNPESTNNVRRVVLPSGRAIDVVYFESTAPSSPAEQNVAPSEVTPLHHCPQCERDLVYPVDWEETSSTHWEVELRCPSCEWSDVGVFDQRTVDQFDDELDRGTEALVRDLKRLTRANMEEEAERFSRALREDAIWPIDF